jgi:ComF family protein
MRRVHESDPAFQASLRRAAESDAISSLVIPWFFEKDRTLQVLIHELKYRRRTVLGIELGREIGRVLLARTDERIDGWIPVPLHISKLRERGFNQSLFIGRGVEAVTGTPRFDGVLARIRYTPSQTALSIPLRAKNVSGAFRVPPGAAHRVEGRTLLLVDDVVTTGATMQACGSALRAAGARAVLGCAIAIAQ